MQVIGRAVERVDYPDCIRILVAQRPRLLGEYRVLRIVLVDDIDDGAFGGAVRLADVIVTALLLHLELLELHHVADERAAGATRGHYRYVE